MFIGRTDVEAEAPIVWPPDAKSWLIWKDPDAGKDWGQEEKGTTEDEMVGWHHWLNGHGFGWTPGVGDGQGGLVCCGSWGCRVGHDWATELNWTGNKATPFLNGKASTLILRLQVCFLVTGNFFSNFPPNWQQASSDFPSSSWGCLCLCVPRAEQLPCWGATPGGSIFSSGGSTLLRCQHDWPGGCTGDTASLIFPSWPSS